MRNLFDRASVALEGSYWGFVAMSTTSFNPKSYPERYETTTLVSRGISKSISESNSEKDVMDILERGKLERTSEILLKNHRIKSRGEVWYYLCVCIKGNGIVVVHLAAGLFMY